VQGFDSILTDFDVGAGAAPGILARVEVELGHRLPPDYGAFLSRWNGGEGFVGDEYLILWRAEDLRQFNDEYEVSEYAPGLLLIGSDGGGEGYAFDTREGRWGVVRVPFIGIALEHAHEVGDSFTGFMQNLKSAL
jgi:hypothetical protein